MRNDCSINFHISKLHVTVANSPYCMIYLGWETGRENWSWSLVEVKLTVNVSYQAVTCSLFLAASAMCALQSKGIVHRDLKPQNLLLSHSGTPNPVPLEIKIKIGKCIQQVGRQRNRFKDWQIERQSNGWFSLLSIIFLRQMDK